MTTRPPAGTGDEPQVSRTAPPSSPTPTPTPPPSPADHAPPPEDLSGRVINNNYRILRLIGRGGMGEVYEGEHLFTGNRIAIKMVLQSLSRDPQILALFKREARTLFQLTDDSIVRYLDSVHDAALDRYCLVMDFIDGTPLSDHVARHGPIPASAAWQLIRRLAGGLDRAHRLGITHRDLSPDNVMLRNDDMAQAVLIDFGIARSDRVGDATLHGQLAGKFKYISPEQLGHFDGVVGPRSDIYGLGLVLAMALRGQPVDMGNSVVAAVEARRAIPSLDGVPPELLPLLSHMLQPDPARRPASMAEVVALIPDPSAAGLPAARPQAGDDRTVIAPMPITPPGQPAVVPGGAPLTALPGLRAGAWPAPSPGSIPAATAGGFQGLPPPPAPPPAPVPSASASSASAQGRRRLPVPAAVLAVLVLGGAAAGWWVQGRPSAPVPATGDLQSGPATPGIDPAAATVAASLPPPDVSTREGLLAARLSPESCAYATRISAGGNSGRVEVYGTDPAASASIAGIYREAFGIAPALIEREVTAPQCAALDLVRGLQGRQIAPPLLTLDGDNMASGGSLIGRISETRGRVVWLFLVSASGAVHDLSPRLEAQADGSWLFAIGARSLSGRAEPQLLVTVASDMPLVTAAAAPAGTQAAQLLPEVLAEIVARENRAAAGMAWFLLTP